MTGFKEKRSGRETNMLRTKLPAVLCALLFGPLAQIPADETPEIGDPAPGWHSLTGTDGKEHSLSDLSDYEAIVVCFTSNTCPYSVDYEDRLVSLQQKYKDAGQKVQLVAINSNAFVLDNVEKMKERASSRSFNFLYLKDETQEVAKKWGAIYTPEFYVLNKARQIIYRGAMDDSTKADQVKARYVELAVDAALAGRKPETEKTGARGCAIRYKRRRR